MLRTVRRQDNDDIAAIEIDINAPPGHKIKGVIIDHLSWVSGKDPMAKPKEQIQNENITFSSMSILEWLKSTVVPDIVEWDEDPSKIFVFIEINSTNT